jgi:putative ABC transport system substrate-binding protein
MDRRTLILAAGGCLLTASFSSHAQKPVKVWRIGSLTNGGRPPDGAPPAAFRKALEEFGYIDGKNVTYISRWSETKFERLPGLAAELVGLDVDLLLTIGAPAADAAKGATSTIPIVVVTPGDADATGLVASLARPGETSPGSPIRPPS